jgi:hypothetical protein
MFGEPQAEMGQPWLAIAVLRGDLSPTRRLRTERTDSPVDGEE